MRWNQMTGKLTPSLIVTVYVSPSTRSMRGRSFANFTDVATLPVVLPDTDSMGFFLRTTGAGTFGDDFLSLDPDLATEAAATRLELV